jgi:hypothetical protein
MRRRRGQRLKLVEGISPRELPYPCAYTASKPAEGLCLLYLSDNVVSPFLPPHLAPGVRRRSAIALRFGGAFEFFELPPSSFVANNEILQQASANPCSSG